MSKFHIPSLDGLRGVAVLLVFLFHFGRLPGVAFRWNVGWVGVQLFFVLSGYLITRILIEQKKNPLGSYLKIFYWRRSLRIFPLYFGYLLALTILFIIFHQPDDFKSIAGYLFSYSFNFSILTIGLHINRLFTHLWSLCVEEQFYIIWPFVVYFFSNNQLKRLSVLLIFAIPLFRWWIYASLKPTISDSEILGTSIYWFSISNFDAFAIGGAVHFLKSKFIGLKSLAWVRIAMVFCIVGGGLNYWISKGGLSITSLGFEIHAIRNYEFIWGYSLLNLLFAAILWHLVQHGSALLSTRPLVFIGKISYGIYVFHFPILGIVSRGLSTSNLPDVVTLVISSTATVIIAWLSFHFFESKFLRLKERFTS
jgi:peptidoglycan/LPS O-acetylase OafA/YrhL